MTDLLLPLWVALIGADRIDLLGGHGPIVLTPFYVLTPLVIGREAVRRSKSLRSSTAPPAGARRRCCVSAPRRRSAATCRASCRAR